MTYPDSVRFLYSLGNEMKTARLGLESIAALLAALGNPHHAPARFIHVAGTNGKGSTCAMIEAGLRASGLRTGLFTSPHLLEPTERIRIGGEPVARERFTRLFDQVHAAADGVFETHPSYFDTVTAMAMLAFREDTVDVTVLEVGLGGRLDSTNIVEPELCVITPIDFDHEKYLGTSLTAIAGEKAGILKRGVPAVIAPQRAEANEVIEARAATLGVPLIRVADWQYEVPRANAVGSHIRIRQPIELGLECCLPGRHQIVNAVTAAAALHAFGIGEDAMRQGVRDAHWPGRLDRISERPEIIVDGAHNPAGARALADYVAEFFADVKPILIFGAMRDKAIEEMAEILFPHFAEVIVTAPAQGRSLSPESLAEATDHPRVRLSATLTDALALIPPDRTAFISGSLFLVAEAMRAFGSI